MNEKATIVANKAVALPIGEFKPLIVSTALMSNDRMRATPNIFFLVVSNIMTRWT